MKQMIYYLPGYDEPLNSVLSKVLSICGYGITGREVVGGFRDLGFQRQVQTIASDLRDHFWHADARVIANSFGAYLLLHALVQLGVPYIGKVLLLSPIVGDFSNEENLMNCSLPQANKLFELAKSGDFPAPLNCEIHIGSEDLQSAPNYVTAFGDLTGIKVDVLEGAGHRLQKTYLIIMVGSFMYVSEN
jgi:hypothetical protein